MAARRGLRHLRAALLGLMASFLAASLPAAPALAQEAARDPALIAFGLGYYDINQRDDEAADFRLEYRSDLALWLIKPWAGLEATSDGALYGVAGLLADLPLGEHVVLTPGLGAGAYRDGGGKDLGAVVEFRSQIELAWRFADASRLGLAFSHISNASLGDDNPGAEILTLYYAIPVERLF